MPEVAVRSGLAEFNRWVLVTGIQKWNYLSCLDVNGVINKIESERDAADLLHRVQTMPNAKLLIVSYVREAYAARHMVKNERPWSILVAKADGVIFALDNAHHDGSIDFWSADTSTNGQVRSRRELKRPDIIFTNGSKGQALGALGNPVILIDDKLVNIAKVHACCRVARCIYVPPPGETSYQRRAVP